MQGIAACGGSSIPDNNSNGTDPVQDKSGDNPQDKCVEELEQDYKKSGSKGTSHWSATQGFAIFKQEKWNQVINGTIPPENLESLDAIK